MEKCKAIPMSKWKWFGCPGHLCVSQDCHFHLATQVGPWFISTVGEYWPRHKAGRSDDQMSEYLSKNWPGEDIGHCRKYETMVFRVAGSPCKDPTCMCGKPDFKAIELYMAGYNKAGDAAAGHMRICREWAKRPARYMAEVEEALQEA